MRRWLYWLLTAIFLWVVVSHRFELQGLLTILAKGRLLWVTIAALLQVVYYLLYTAVYQAAFAAVEVESSLFALLPVLFTSIFVNVAVPSAGASGAALFVDDAAQRGQSPARAAAGTLLVLIADFGMFAVVLLVGLIYLVGRHSLTANEIAAAAVLMLIVGGLVGLLSFGLWQPVKLRLFLTWCQCRVNHLAGLIGRGDLLKDGWAERNTTEFGEAARMIAVHPFRLVRTLLIALAAHLVDLTSLCALFWAFHYPIGFGPLVTGFAIGILAWIVSPIPQGIGVVEGAMALAFVSIGVRADIATVVTLAFRGMTFWLPLGLGFFLFHRVRSFGAATRPRRGDFHVKAIAALAAVMGLVNLLSAVTPSLRDRLVLLARFLPLAILRGGHLTTTLAGFALLMLANGLRHRQRSAWVLTLIVLLVSIISHLVKGLDYEEATLAALLMIWMLTAWARFHAHPDPPSVRQGLGVLGAAVLFTLAYGVTGLYLLDRHFSVNFGLWAALRQTVIMFTQYYDPGLQPVTGFGRYFAGSIYLVSAFTVGYALLKLIRPVLLRGGADPADRARARAVIEQYGRSSMARMALLGDKSFFFTKGGSVIAYVVKGHVALVLGDPIGPEEDAESAIGNFSAHCSRHAWQAAFYQAGAEYLPAYRAAGLDALCIGAEGIMDLQAFKLEGGTYKTLRNTLSRLKRAEARAVLHSPPHEGSLLAEMREISDDWLTTVRGMEKRFSMGWFDAEYLNSCPILAVHSSDGRVMAFANIVTEYRKNEITLDLMRRRSSAESGTMDFLLLELFRWAKEQGYDTFSLGLSSLAGEGKKDRQAGNPWDYVIRHLGRFYNFHGLHAFKEKFHPVWAPRYLIFPGLASLPGVANTLIRADSGDGFFWEYLTCLWARNTGGLSETTNRRQRRPQRLPS